MSTSQKFAILVVSLALLIGFIEAGPLSFSLSRAYRNGREIRAPFKNPEIMVARGFGKRDVANGGRNHVLGNEVDREKNDIMLDDQENGSIPIEWFAKELITNPSLARAILHRFVDANRDGAISVKELMHGGAGGPISFNNNNNLNNNEIY